MKHSSASQVKRSQKEVVVGDSFPHNAVSWILGLLKVTLLLLFLLLHVKSDSSSSFSFSS